MPLLNLEELFLVPNIITPPKFKGAGLCQVQGDYLPQEPSKDVLSEDGGAYAKDEKLLIHFSQESLTRTTVTWYTNLEPSRVHSWKDLMVAFVRQYRYNSDMAPNRMQL